MVLSKSPVEITPELRRSSERNAILSAATAAMGDIMLVDSAVIIIFAQKIGAGDMFSMLTTSLLPLFNGLCVIPMAWVAGRTGYQTLIVRVISVAFLAYLTIAAAPFFGKGAVAVMLGMLVLFSIMTTGYVAAWFPMLDTFLLQEKRGAFLGTMRFSWQLSSTLFLLAAGYFIGKDPSTQKLQIVLLVGALCLLGRIFFISRIPVFKVEKKEQFGFADGLRAALANKPLAGYSVYLFVLNLAAYGTLPLSTLYLKNHLHAPDNLNVMISAMTLAGMLIGSLCGGKLITKFGLKRTFLGIHISYAVINFSLFFIGKGNPFTYSLITFLLVAYSFTFAAASIASTSEMMALATPGNKAMAMAFCGTFYYTGSGLSRMLSSLVLGSGILSAHWSIGSMELCQYQSLFLIYSVAIVFAAMFLVIVPAIFPKGEYIYAVH